MCQAWHSIVGSTTRRCLQRTWVQPQLPTIFLPSLFWCFFCLHVCPLARQAITQKSLFLAHHHEHLCRQAYFLYKEHAARWYVEAQHAAGVAISTLRVFFFFNKATTL